MKSFLIRSSVLLTFLISSNSKAQVHIDVNINVQHTVGGLSEFDRSKFITIHANQTEGEWDGDNFTTDLRDDFLNGYDVYLGRDTGGITGYLNQVQEDPARPGFADPAEIAIKGQNARNHFASLTHLHQYESRKKLIIAGQLHPFWTGASQKPTAQGWSLANATATGEYMGRYINAFHGGNGQTEPAFVEIINEPAYESLGGPDNHTNSSQEIAEFHNEVAAAIRQQNPNVLIGGYTTAFPDFEKGDFQRWNNRWKLFMDVAGAQMDFWSLHLYDWPSIGGGKVKLRSGSNIEATLDMMEHYSQLSFNKVKPFVISEYGAQMNDYMFEQWSPYRDWLFLKCANSQLMSFLQRPDNIHIALPFLIVKAEWGYEDVPYNHRLMRKANEPDSYTGQWVYTDMLKFYQLWQNVKGTRVDTVSEDIDIQVDAYVDGNKAYLILNNLNTTDIPLNINLFDTYDVDIIKIQQKHLTLSGNTPVLEENELSPNTTVLTLGAESTMILTYTFKKNITINQTSKETKYYANTYNIPVTANQDKTFTVNSIDKGAFGEAILRLGVGRTHDKSLKPAITINGTPINVPDDWLGYDQSDRDSFFGVLEIPVPFDVLAKNNKIKIRFPDSGGHISSLSMQVFNFSTAIKRRNDVEFNADTIKIHPNPANGSFKISVPNSMANATMSVYDTQGRLITTKKISGTTHTLRMPHLAKGMYIVTFQKNNTTPISTKLIID
ncbi:MAG: T9SS type A sorting domain-containing protein [Bacteroidota bacterium]